MEESIKSLERDRRSATGTLRVLIMGREQPVPKQFGKFLRDAENKIALIHFFIKDWSTNLAHHDLLEDKKLYVTIEDKAYCITSKDSNVSINAVPELSSKQEEADTKIFLCAKFATTFGFQAIKIITVDSDVAILAIYFQPQISARIFLQMGTGRREKTYLINSINIPEEERKALPSIHALSGCDSTSCFSGFGKVKFYKTVRSDERFLTAASLLGENDEIPDTVVNVLEEFVCKLYGAKQEHNIDKVRLMKLTESKKLPEPQRLPPTKDALKLHLMRCNYQVSEWKQALNAHHAPKTPVGRGWKIEGGKLSIQWMTKKPAPDEILEFTSCNCKKSNCSSRKGRCFSIGLRCTDVCHCFGCLNGENDDVSSGEEEEDENVNYDENDDDCQSSDDNTDVEFLE